jgi:hypothetical protein
MNIVQFRRAAEPASRRWSARELTRLTNVCAAAIPAGGISGWEIGVTEQGDPQLYVIGPGPEFDCVLSISRLGRHYVLEDGRGGLLYEHDDIMLLAEQTCDLLRRRKNQIIAQLTLGLCALREFFEERVEPALAEPMEAFTHLAPTLGALA